MKARLTSLVVFLVVVSAHAGVIAGAIHLTGRDSGEITLPVIEGVLIMAPPAAAAQAPVAPDPNPTPPPKPKPEPKPEPKLKPKPKLKPEPKPKPPPKPELPAPPVKAPPSEKAITAPPEEEPVEQVVEETSEKEIEGRPTEPAEESAPLPAEQASRQTDAPPRGAAEESSGDTAAAVVQPREDARAFNNRQPRYPNLSRRLGEQGTVVLELVIEPDGTVSDLRVLESSGYPRLDKAALEAVQTWRYHPATRGGKPIRMRYVQEITFRLD